MKVKPAPCMKVRDPDLLDLLPADGRTVPDSSYWRRRVRDGDVVPVDVGESSRTKGTQTATQKAAPKEVAKDTKNDKPASTQ